MRVDRGGGGGGGGVRNTKPKNANGTLVSKVAARDNANILHIVA